MAHRSSARNRRWLSLQHVEVLLLAATLLGTVTDILGATILPVRAAYAGMVIVLHTCARVESGVSVAVVLEVR